MYTVLAFILLLYVVPSQVCILEYKSTVISVFCQGPESHLFKESQTIVNKCNVMNSESAVCFQSELECTGLNWKCASVTSVCIIPARLGLCKEVKFVISNTE